MAQVAQKSGGYIIPVGVQGFVGWDPGQSNLVEDIPALWRGDWN